MRRSIEWLDGATEAAVGAVRCRISGLTTGRHDDEGRIRTRRRWRRPGQGHRQQLHQPLHDGRETSSFRYRHSAETTNSSPAGLRAGVVMLRRRTFLSAPQASLWQTRHAAGTSSRDTLLDERLQLFGGRAGTGQQRHRGADSALPRSCCHVHVVARSRGAAHSVATASAPPSPPFFGPENRGAPGLHS